MGFGQCRGQAIAGGVGAGGRGRWSGAHVEASCYRSVQERPSLNQSSQLSDRVGRALRLPSSGRPVETRIKRTPPEADVRLDVVAVGSPLVGMCWPRPPLTPRLSQPASSGGRWRSSTSLTPSASTPPWDRPPRPRAGRRPTPPPGSPRSEVRPAFVGKVADDPLGQAFTHDIRAAGVEFLRPWPSTRTRGPRLSTGQERSAPAAAWCWSPGTPSAPWPPTWAWPPPSPPTTCGRRWCGGAGVVYLEGYLWDLPPAKASHATRPLAVAHENDGSVALVALRCLLRRPPPSRVPRPPPRRCRRALRQRGRDHPIVRHGLARSGGRVGRGDGAPGWPSPSGRRARWY